jgi:hypothetical protein
VNGTRKQLRDRPGKRKRNHKWPPRSKMPAKWPCCLTQAPGWGSWMGLSRHPRCGKSHQLLCQTRSHDGES